MKKIHRFARLVQISVCGLIVLPSSPAHADATDEVFDLSTATIPEITTAMNSKALTSVELVGMYLRRIQAYDQASPLAPAQPLNSVLALNPDLLDDAAEADRMRKNGVVLGELHGIPFLVKGSYSIRNMPITGGHNGWKDLVTLQETWSVQKMRQAGGIVMGHANMDTWANSAANSVSQIKGAVRSSYLAGALPGGSSGGSGVSSGAYLTNFTFGGETGGSIRNPSDRSGLVGYKVSGGSISVNRIIPLAPERDVIGPMTRSSSDNALLRDIVGAADPDDIWAPIIPILADRRPLPESGFVAALKGATLQGKKIGIIGTYAGMPNPTPGENSTNNTTQVFVNTPATIALVQQAKLDMEAAGATVSYVFMPPQVSTTYVRAPGSPVTRLLTAPYSNLVASFSYRSLIESIVTRPGDSYDAIAAKVIATAALVNNISATVRNGMYTLDPVTLKYSDGPAIDFGSPEGVEHYMARAQQKNAFEDWMDAEGLDVVIWPMYPNKTPTGGTIIGRDLVNFMYLPAVTVPMGVLQHDEARREPLTMNFTGRLYDDAKVLAIAHAYEQATHHRYSPPLAPPLPGETFAFKDRVPVGSPKVDNVPPVLTVVNSVLKKNNSISFTGTVVDKSPVDRLEVSVGGVLLSSAVVGTRWTAVLPAESYQDLLSSEISKIEVLVLAVDLAGNAALEMAPVNL